MSQIKVKIYTPEEMTSLGEVVANASFPNLVIALVGDLGAGKTTFTKGIGKALGIKRVINSPTFTIMKVYDTTSNEIKKLYHLDVYRLTDSESDFELEEYFYMDGLTVVEWAHIIDDILPKNMWEIEINDLGNNERLVTINGDEEVIKKVSESGYEIIYR